MAMHQDARNLSLSSPLHYRNYQPSRLTMFRFRLKLSQREEMLAQRGVILTDKTIRPIVRHLNSNFRVERHMYLMSASLTGDTTKI